jgi:hypothetical protein
VKNDYGTEWALNGLEELLKKNVRTDLGSTQPLTELSIRILPGGKGRPARKADKLTALFESIV